MSQGSMPAGSAPPSSSPAAFLGPIWRPLEGLKFKNWTWGFRPPGGFRRPEKAACSLLHPPEGPVGGILLVGGYILYSWPQAAQGSGSPVTRTLPLGNNFKKTHFFFPNSEVESSAQAPCGNR